MTIPAATPTFVQLPGNGSATVFAFPFKIFQASDLVVGFITVSGYTQQVAGFTVQNVDTNGGGTITFAVAPPNGTTVDIRSLTAQIQNTEFANLGAFLPENHTEALDRLTRMVQDLYRLVYLFGMHGPDQEGTPWPALPAASLRANGILTFDGNGHPQIGTQSGGAFTVQQATTAIANQTAFTLPVSVALGGVTLLVSLNGAVLVAGDDYTTAGTTLTLLNAAGAGDRLQVIAIVA